MQYYLFAVKLDRCAGICNSINDLSNKICVPNKTEDLNISMFNMVAGIKESKTLTNHISCECKCKFDETKSRSHQWWNNGKCRCECKKTHVCEKDYVWNPPKSNYENGKYLGSIMNEIICDEIIDVKETNFNEKK